MAKTGVSLHCHTEHSKEMLDFLPHYAEKLPIIAQFWHKERDKYVEREGKDIDFSTAFWSPPLTAEAVYGIEKQQIDDHGLRSLVSLTDHDSIAANLNLNETVEAAPISLEWTVPFEYGYFHVGVHNLPQDTAGELTETLLDYTFNGKSQSNARLTEVFAMLAELAGVLVVLNHPLWDIEMVGKERHELLLKDFIRVHGKWINAFEVNGFRKWSENKRVIEMAESFGIPVVTGGDRHGCSPNTVVNLTQAESFDEFAEEIRIEKRSQIALMPEYEHPLMSRQLHSFAQILRLYPEFPEHRRRWFDRVHIDIGDGKGLVPLSAHGWTRGGPTWLRAAIWTLGVLGGPALVPVFRMTRRSMDRVPRDVAKAKFEIAPKPESAPEFVTESA